MGQFRPLLGGSGSVPTVPPGVLQEALGGKPMKTFVYVDAFNLYYGAVKDTPYKWLDLQALCRVMLPQNTVARIKYFTARVQTAHRTSRPCAHYPQRTRPHASRPPCIAPLASSAAREPRGLRSLPGVAARPFALRAVPGRAAVPTGETCPAT
jgi:hypothetical protein